MKKFMVVGHRGDKMNRPKTIFCDIDGTLIKHHGAVSQQIAHRPEILDGILEKLDSWDRACYNIILTTGRKESLRDMTEKQLNSLGIIYDQLIMGLGGGTRILINDLKPDSDEPTAIAINLKRNKGIKNVDI